MALAGETTAVDQPLAEDEEGRVKRNREREMRRKVGSSEIVISLRPRLFHPFRLFYFHLHF